MTIHIPVLPDETIESMQILQGHTVVDGTFGGGGHSKRILKLLGPAGKLIAFDRDPLTIDAALNWIPENATVVNANYADIPEVLAELHVPLVNSIVLDLGLSSDQLEDRDRGFSFNCDGSLDLRFNPHAGEPAWRLVNRLGEKHLADLIYQFGEEKFSRRIARKICQVRHDTPIKIAKQFATIVRSCVPRQRHNSIDPATRTFQALRIAVNDELKWLKVAMNRLPKLLLPGGRLVVISFHSLEDRIVKTAFASDETLKVISKRPIMASDQELSENPRSRSAKLRVAEKR